MKKNVKRILALATVVILAVSLLIPVGVFNSLANGTFTVVVSASKTDLQPGDSFDVTITLNNIPGVLKSGSIDIPIDTNYIDTTTFSYVKATGTSVTANDGKWNSTAGAFRCAFTDLNGYVTGPSLVLGKFVIKVKSTVTPPASTGLGWAGNLIRIVSTAPFKDTSNAVQTATFNPTNIPLSIIANPADQNAANAVITQINALPAVGSLALTDKPAVTAARTAYTGLTSAQQALVTNLATLTAAETKIAELQTAADNQAAANTVIAQINALPAVGSLALTDKTAVTAARTAYTGLTAAQQALVTNLATLTAAETKIAELQTAADNQAAANTVIAQINALPAVGSLALTDKTAVTAARTAYTGLTAAQQALVTNLATLTAAETKIAELQTAADNQAAANTVIAQINALPAVGSLALTDKPAVTAARTAYDNLTAAQKLLVSNLATLTAAETKIAELQTAADNQAAANTVIAKINLIPSLANLALTDKTKVTDARTAYNALTADQKLLVTNYTALTSAETKIADLEAATPVITKINAIPALASLALTDKTKVTDARTAYNALTADQKLLVTNYTALTSAETKIADLEAASAVTTKINAIPALDSLELTNKAAVTTARAAYDDLTITQKTYVTNLATLTAAETKIADLEAASEVITSINAIPALDSLELADKALVTAARAAYDDLTETQKGYVTNLTALTDAEAKIADFESTPVITAKDASNNIVADNAILPVYMAVKITTSEGTLAATKNTAEYTMPANDTFTEAGTYVITATDAVGNTATFTFTLIPTAAAGTLTDNATGITVNFGANKLPEEVILKVTKEANTSITGATKTAIEIDGVIVAVYDISFLMGDVKVQPNGTVKVSLPIPDDKKNSTIKVKHIKADGSVEDMTFTVVNGFAVFDASSFSNYVITEQTVSSSVSSSTSSTGNTANTGDNFILYLALALIALTSVFVLRRRFAKN